MTLERPRFATTRLTEGYDMGEVDDFVDLVFKVLAQDEPTLTPEQIESVRFTPVRLREGYQMSGVDDWLDLAVAELRSGGSTTTTPAQDVPPVASSPDPSRPPREQAATSTAITEVSTGGTGLYVLLVAILVVIGVVVYALVA